MFSEYNLCVCVCLCGCVCVCARANANIRTCVFLYVYGVMRFLGFSDGPSQSKFFIFQSSLTCHNSYVCFSAKESTMCSNYSLLQFFCGLFHLMACGSPSKNRTVTRASSGLELSLILPKPQIPCVHNVQVAMTQRPATRKGYNTTADTIHPGYNDQKNETKNGNVSGVCPQTNISRTASVCTRYD